MKQQEPLIWFELMSDRLQVRIAAHCTKSPSSHRN